MTSIGLRVKKAEELTRSLMLLAYNDYGPEVPDGYVDEGEVLKTYGRVFELQYVGGLSKEDALKMLHQQGDYDHQRDNYNIACQWVEGRDMPEVVAEMVALLRPSLPFHASGEVLREMLGNINAAAQVWATTHTVDSRRVCRDLGLILRVWADMLEAICSCDYKYMPPSEAEAVAQSYDLSCTTCYTYWREAWKLLEVEKPPFYFDALTLHTQAEFKNKYIDEKGSLNKGWKGRGAKIVKSTRAQIKKETGLESETFSIDLHKFRSAMFGLGFTTTEELRHRLGAEEAYYWVERAITLSRNKTI